MRLSIRWAAAALLLAIAAFSGAQVPNWAVGTFRGFNGYISRDVEMSIQRGGSVVRNTWDRNGRRRTDTGLWRSGEIRIGGASYDVDRRGSGIRVTNEDNERDWMDLTPNGRFEYPTSGSGGGGTGNVPSWAVGVFRGYDGYTDRDVQLTVEQSGRAVAEVYTRGGSRRTLTGWLRQTTLSLSGEDYYLDQVSNGVKLTNLDNRSDWMELKRNGKFEFTKNGDWGSHSSFPGWMVGNWGGFWKGAGSDVDIRIPRSGRGTIYVLRTGKTFGVSWEGGDRVKFESGYSFRVTQIGDAFRLVNVADSADTSTYRRD